MYVHTHCIKRSLPTKLVNTFYSLFDFLAAVLVALKQFMLLSVWGPHGV